MRAQGTILHYIVIYPSAKGVRYCTHYSMKAKAFLRPTNVSKTDTNLNKNALAHLNEIS